MLVISIRYGHARVSSFNQTFNIAWLKSFTYFRVTCPLITLHLTFVRRKIKQGKLFWICKECNECLTLLKQEKTKEMDALLMAYRVNLLMLHRDTHVKIFFDCSNAVMQKGIVENCIRTILETNFQVFAPIKYNSLSRFYMRHFSSH